MKLNEKINNLLKKVTGNVSEQKLSLITNIIIIILINIVSATLYFRIDLTKNGVYSLSDISKEVVSNLQEPLTIKIFFTQDLPAPYNTVSRYLTDLIAEYDIYGNKNFHYEFVDVEKDKQVADTFGIFPVQIREVKDDQIKFRKAYMGIAIVHGDLIEKIDSITEAEGLEYQITNLIKKMNGKIDSLQGLKNPVKVTLYSSSNLPIRGMKDISQRVEEVVNKSSEKNYNKLKYQFVEMSNDENSKKIIDQYGLYPLKWPSFTGPTGEFVKEGSGAIGIVAELGNQFETIQILSRNIFGQVSVSIDNLEENLNDALENLISINPKIGYITGHGEKDIEDDREGAKNFKNLISDMYEFKTLDISKEDIPDEINVIIINGPKNQYSDVELYRIDQFLMKGRSAIFLLDSFNEMNQQQNPMFQQQPLVLPLNTGLEALLSYYGITINKDVVLDLSCYKTSNKMFGEQDVYFVPMIDDDGLNDDNVITKYLKRIFLIKASSLSINKDDLEKKGLKPQVLISSSEKSWLMQGRVNFNPMFMRPPKDTEMKRYDLAVLINGEIESYFKDKPAPALEGGAKMQRGISADNVIKKAIKPANLLVIGTSEITGSNIVDKKGTSPNAILLHNMIDYLSGNVDIPEMRTKGLAYNPLSESGEGTKLVLKVFNIAGLPILVIIAGMLMWRFRNIRRKKLMNEFKGGSANE